MTNISSNNVNDLMINNIRCGHLTEKKGSIKSRMSDTGSCNPA